MLRLALMGSCAIGADSSPHAGSRQRFGDGWLSLIERDWSPQQVAGWGSRFKHFAISHETIYRRIWADRRAGGSLYRHLRLKLRRCRRYCVRRSRGLIVGRVGIEHRPRIVERKARIGDWELDTLFGRRMRGGLLTASERKSRLTGNREDRIQAGRTCRGKTDRDPQRAAAQDSHAHLSTTAKNSPVIARLPPRFKPSSTSPGPMLPGSGD